MRRSAVVRLGACAAVALAAACGSHARRPEPAPAADPSETARREPFVVAQSDAVFAVARDATHLYWADPAGLHRRPLGDAEAGAGTLVSNGTAGFADVTGMVVAGDRVYLSDGVSVFAAPAAGGALEPVAEGIGTGIAGLAVTDEGEVIVAAADTILRIPKTGAPVVLAGGQIRVTSVAVSRSHVYWTDYGEELAATAQTYYYAGMPLPEGLGTVRRVPIRGGVVEELATGQRGPSSIVVDGDRVWWTDDRTPAVQSLPAGGGAPRVELRGRADRLAHDDDGLVVLGAQGLISEWTGAATGEVRMVADGTWHAAARPPVLAAGWIYVIATHPYEPRQAVIALPRQDAALDVITSSDDAIARVRARDGVVSWLEMSRVGPGFSFWQRGPDDREARHLANHEGYVSDFAAGDGEVYFAEDTTIYRVDARGRHQVATSPGYPIALTVHRNHLFWLDGNQLFARTRKKRGEPFLIARLPDSGGSESGADLVFDDDYVYVPAYGAAGMSIYRVSERGRARVLWEPGSSGVTPLRDLAAVGGEIFFTASMGGSYGVFRLPPEGDGTAIYTVGGDRYLSELAAGGGFLYVTVAANEAMELVRIDPSTGAATVVLRWQQYAGEPGLLAADERGAYLGIEPYDAVIRVAHDAPAITPIAASETGR